MNSFSHSDSGVSLIFVDLRENSSVVCFHKRAAHVETLQIGGSCRAVNMNFESVTELEHNRQLLREARHAHLEKASCIFTRFSMNTFKDRPIHLQNGVVVDMFRIHISISDIIPWFILIFLRHM